MYKHTESNIHTKMHTYIHIPQKPQAYTLTYLKNTITLLVN